MPAKNGFKTSITEIPRRYSLKENKTEGILNYDNDNAYPRRVELMIEASVTGSRGVDLYKKFMAGRGFTNEAFGRAVINEKGQTINELLKTATAKDKAKFASFAFHFNYNALFQISEIRAIEVKDVRFTLNNSDHAGKYALYEDWARELKSRISPSDIKYIDKFNPDPKVIQRQILAAGGFEHWNGQIFYWSAAGDKYPLPVYDPAINDLETDGEISLFKRNNVTTQFLAMYILMLKQEFEDDTERQEYIQTLNKFMGGRESGKILLLDGITEENKPELQKIDLQNADRLFEYHETSAQNNIRKSFLIPKELIGEEYSTGFADDKIQQARNYFNSVTEFDREEISEQFAKFIPYFYKAINPEGNYDIKPLYVEEKI
jgi:hypothetical protein